MEEIINKYRKIYSVAYGINNHNSKTLVEFISELREQQQLRQVLRSTGEFDDGWIIVDIKCDISNAMMDTRMIEKENGQIDNSGEFIDTSVVPKFWFGVEKINNSGNTLAKLVPETHVR